MNDYNFEMTGKPSDNELATNPDLANAWYAFSGTSPEPASTTPPIWLRPEDYTGNGFAAPYTKEQANATVNPNDIRQGAGGVSYAAISGPSSYYDPTTAGEYVVDTKTGKFAKDANGNLIPVPRPNTTSNGWFNDWGVLAVPLLAAGGVAALEGLGAIGGAEAAGAAGSGSWGLTPELAAELGLDYSTSGLTDLSGNAGSAFLESLGLNTAGGIGALSSLSGATLANALKGGASLASIAKALGVGGTGSSGRTATTTTTPTVINPNNLANALRNMGTANQGQFGTGFGLTKGNVNPFLFAKEMPVQTQTASKADPFAALNVAQTPIQPFNPLAHIVG